MQHLSMHCIAFSVMKLQYSVELSVDGPLQVAWQEGSLALGVQGSSKMFIYKAGESSLISPRGPLRVKYV